jgi:hypothetical protein
VAQEIYHLDASPSLRRNRTHQPTTSSKGIAEAQQDAIDMRES